jgi:hypothetical protein
MITPSLEEFVEKQRARVRVQLRRRIPADLETPVSAFLKLRGANGGGAIAERGL